jgi:hypothetical protein
MSNNTALATLIQAVCSASCLDQGLFSSLTAVLSQI